MPLQVLRSMPAACLALQGITSLHAAQRAFAQQGMPRLIHPNLPTPTAPEDTLIQYPRHANTTDPVT